MWHSRPRLCSAARLPVFERSVYCLLEWQGKIGVLGLDFGLTGYRFSFFFLDGCNQLVKSIVEELDCVFQKFIGDVFHGDAGFFQVSHRLVSGSKVGIQGAAYLAMIAEGIKSGWRNGVDRVRADQFLEVHHVSVIRILGAGAGPQQALSLRSTARQSLPTV